jgi:hypothetical protein
MLIYMTQNLVLTAQVKFGQQLIAIKTSNYKKNTNVMRGGVQKF